MQKLINFLSNGTPTIKDKEVLLAPQSYYYRLCHTSLKMGLIPNTEVLNI